MRNESPVHVAYLRRVAAAESIVRALADTDPVSGAMCELCEATTRSGSSHIRPNDHDAFCPWRRAREWVAEHPEETT